MFQQKINTFVAGDFIEGFLAVREATLQTASNGKPYIRLTLSDSTGTISGSLWEADKELFATIIVGGALKLQAVVEVYRNALQLRISRLRVAKNEEITSADFIATTKFNVADLEKEILTTIEKITDDDYRRLLQSFFSDEKFRAKFRNAPAARSNHHAWIGGLLEHTANLLRYTNAFLTNTPTPLNNDLLIAGVILHDAGKIHELKLSTVIEYSDYGKLIGHISIGVMMIEEATQKLTNFPAEKKWLLQHLLLSHHGKLEYGSPILPAIPEAFALNHLDNLDAKTTAAVRIIEEDHTAGNWTARSYMLESALYKAPHN